jgi:uncharacterized protein (TIGR02001 family)
MRSSHKFSLSAVGLAVALALPMAAAQADLAGNIGVHSKYLLRGIGLENDNTAVQGGVDYTHESGFYAGWWGSNLSYGDNGNGFENDLYAGFAGSAGDFSYKAGLIQYVYVNVPDSDLTEFLGNVGYGPFNVQMQYLLNDGAWGNGGDIYWTANYSAELPSKFKFGASLGWYTYDDSDPAKYGLTTTSDSGFRHLNLTMSHPMGNTGADMYVQYTFAGEDREGDDSYDDKVVFGLTYGFGL